MAKVNQRICCAFKQGLQHPPNIQTRYVIVVFGSGFHEPGNLWIFTRNLMRGSWKSCFLLYLFWKCSCKKKTLKKKSQRITAIKIRPCKPIPYMGLVHLFTWTVDFSANHVGKYTIFHGWYWNWMMWILNPLLSVFQIVQCTPIFLTQKNNIRAVSMCLFSVGCGFLAWAPWSQEILIKAFYEKHLKITKKQQS